jgi:two-component system chemotaxis sensor kinase CheA
MAIEDVELRQGFVTDAQDALEKVDQELVKLEKDPHCVETLNSIFRGIHTIKGTAGFFEFTKLEGLAHIGENLLDALRSQKIKITDERSSALLEMVDAIKAMLTSVAENGTDGPKDHADLKTHLKTLLEDSPTAPIVKKEEQYQETTLPAPGAEPTIMSAAPEETTPEPSKSTEKTVTIPAQGNTTLRIDVRVLDSLMNLVGELVLARNQLLQYTEDSPESPVGIAVQRLNTITSELQDGVMRARLQPIESVWRKFPRVVRDLSKQSQKKINLVMVGEETELDKTVLEAIQDPLTHLIRNSIDHGIELPATRTKSGKKEEATITLRAVHQGEHVLIEIVDDGAGLNTERIKQKAIEKGLYTKEQVQSMSLEEIHALIFAAGFSTAEKITSLSGRGVGMDVVRSNIERVGGTVRINSVSGKGCTVQIKLPLTLLIAPALTVTVQEQLFAIPQHHILELVKVDRNAEGHWPFEVIGGGILYPLRDELLPVVDLAEILHLSPLRSSVKNELNLIVVESSSLRFGLLVENIHDTQELVVKPLCKPLRMLHLYSGATIMGDGSLALMLYIPGVALKAQLGVPPQNDSTNKGTVDNIEQKKSYLKVESTPKMHVGIPLGSVVRLEEISASKVQSLPHCSVVNYHGSLLPVFNLSHITSKKKQLGGVPETLPIIICRNDKVEFGLIVERILDIVETNQTILPIGRGDCIEGSILIDDSALSIVDIQELLSSIESTTQPMQAHKETQA